MISIEVSTTTSTRQDMVYLLQEVVHQIEQGYNSGVGDVVWSISGEEEFEKEEEFDDENID